MTGIRLLIGLLFMGIALPIILFFLLGMSTLSQLLTIAASTFLAWGVADLFARILEKPRLRDRSPVKAIKEETERRSDA